MQKEYRLDYDVVLKSVDKILEVLSRNDPGRYNPKARKEIFTLAKRMGAATTDAYIGGRAVKINIWADVIYDDKKHEGDFDFQQDIDTAVSFLRRDCEEARDHAEHVKNAGKSTSKQ